MTASAGVFTSPSDTGEARVITLFTAPWVFRTNSPLTAPTAIATVIASLPRPVFRVVIVRPEGARRIESTRIVSLPQPVHTVTPPVKASTAVNEMVAGAMPSS